MPREALAVDHRAAVAAVHLKILPFWPADPEVWFAQVDAQFTTRGITVQKTKFDHIVASLSHEVATEVRDLILHQPTDQPYNILKEHLIKRTATSEQRKLQQLFNAEEGTVSPHNCYAACSNYWATERALLILRELFFQHLLNNVRMVLGSTADTVTLQQLAELVDRIIDVAAPSESAVHTPQLSADVDQLRTEVTKLQRLDKSLSTRSHLKLRCSPTPSHSATPSRSPTSNSPILCWYNQKYRKDAIKCKSPCDWALTTRPLTSGGECCWPSTKSPILCY